MSDIKRAMPAGGMNMGDSGMGESAFTRGEQPIMTQPPFTPKKSGFVVKLFYIIAVAVVILIGLFLVSKYTSLNILNVNKGISSSGWQAVFLDNGQVYFGHITKQNSRTVVLKEVYYLQVAQSPQPAPEGQQPQNNLSLVKLGNELHGPKDVMNVNVQHILFTEDLKNDSQVVTAIVRYLEDQKK